MQTGHPGSEKERWAVIRGILFAVLPKEAGQNNMACVWIRGGC